jgi:hypothetical protein
MFGPEWMEAGADAAMAVEKGIAMVFKSGDKHEAVPAAPTPSAGAITPHDLYWGAILIGGCVVLFITAMATAMIIHHGLTHMA